MERSLVEQTRLSDPSSAGVLLTRLGGFIVQRNRSGPPEIRPPRPLSTPLAGRHKGSPPIKKTEKKQYNNICCKHVKIKRLLFAFRFGQISSPGRQN